MKPLCRLAAILCLSLYVVHSQSVVQAQGQQPRRIGVALSGGDALSLAHIGVIRYFEEHHIPIDEIAGTSMGGLIGGL